MNDQNLEPLSAAAQGILDLEKSRPAPPEIPVDHLFDRLSQTLHFQVATTAAAGMSSASGGGVSTAVSATKTAVATKLVTAIALVTLGAASGVGGTVAVMHQTQRRLEMRVEELESAARSAPAPVAAVEVSRPEVAVPEAPVARVAAISVPKVSPKTAKTPPSELPEAADSLAAETALIDRARTAMLRGEPESALTALRVHAAEYRTGRLSEERDALLVQVLMLLHRKTEAVEASVRFKSEYPRSLLTQSVESAINASP